MVSKEERQKARIHQRLRDAYLMGLRARKFTPAEMLKQADELIAFSLKIRPSKPIRKVDK